jgi:hypothetical protein
VRKDVLKTMTDPEPLIRQDTAHRMYIYCPVGYAYDVEYFSRSSVSEMLGFSAGENEERYFIVI